MRRFFTFILSFLIISLTYSQTEDQSTLEKIRQQQILQGGTLVGKIRDQKTGEELIGANVAVINTKLGASTDIEGRFQIKRIPEGIYDIRVSFIGYESKVVTGISLKTNEQTSVDISLNEDQGIQQQEVVISAEAIKSGEGAILAERKKSGVIGDGISSEQMKRAPDATSGDALKRVIGLSLVDNKFVFIRGASERYNGTTLNGASVTSTEVGKRSFSFDMIPANLLANTIVVKSAMPDLPGDFTGGLVQMNTLDFPEHSMFKVALSTGINTVTTYKSFNSSQGGKNDWIGSDDGTRSLPAFSTAAELGKILPNTWSSRSIKAPMNAGLNLSFGDNLSLGSDENQFGYIGALTYKNSFQRTEKNINALSVSRYLQGTQNEFSVLWGGLLNLSYKSGDNKISFKNNYNQTADDEIRLYSGYDGNTDRDVRYTNINWSERRSYQGILGGNHFISSLGNLSIDWKVSLSSSNRNDPDRKEITYDHDATASSDVPFEAAINKRVWSRLNDRNTGANTDLSLPLGDAKIKSGAFFEKKKTGFNIRYFKIIPNYRLADVSNPITTIYSQENFINGQYSISEESKPTDNYSGNQELFAGYAMTDIPFTVYDQIFRFIGGARLEHSIQNIFVPQYGTLDKATQLANVDILPSLNLIYILTENANLRLAYSHTLNRPEFRELASSTFYDFIRYVEIAGNPNLKRSYVHNYDARFEIFPEPGEVLAASLFYKTISGAIEETYNSSSGVQYSTAQQSWENAHLGKDYGWELELRRSLGFITEYLAGISVTGNYSRIFSQVDYTKTEGNSTSSTSVTLTRPFQGQSPYMINLGLFYTQNETGTSINLLYNKFGRRIDAVGVDVSDIYEEPRDLVDASIIQNISSSLEAKLTVKNLTNKDRILTQDGKLYDKSKRGITYDLQFSYGL